MSASTYSESKITFRYLKPIGFAIDGVSGNFFPMEATMYREVQGHNGRFPFDDIDLNHVHTVPIEDEFPKELPDVFDDLPDEVRKQYYTQQATNAAAAHDRNNSIRRQLDYYIRQGYIEVLSDTFMDHLKDKKAAKAAKQPKTKAAE